MCGRGYTFVSGSGLFVISFAVMVVVIFFWGFSVLLGRGRGVVSAISVFLYTGRGSIMSLYTGRGYATCISYCSGILFADGFAVVLFCGKGYVKYTLLALTLYIGRGCMLVACPQFCSEGYVKYFFILTLYIDRGCVIVISPKICSRGYVKCTCFTLVLHIAGATCSWPISSSLLAGAALVCSRGYIVYDLYIEFGRGVVGELPLDFEVFEPLLVELLLMVCAVLIALYRCRRSVQFRGQVRNTSTTRDK